MKNSELWNKILTNISQELAPISFNTWFKDTSLYKIEEQTITIKVPMPIHKKLLGETYYELLENMLFEETGNNYLFKFVCEEDIKEEEISEPIIENSVEDKIFNSNLISKYTFENFVVGDTNRFAQNAAMTVAQNPGKIYNPLFIHGKSGLGKTHLMHAIGNYIIEHSDKNVLYITSDEFMTDYTSLSNHAGENNFDYINKFKHKYRSVDVLLIDDIQFLAGAEKTQREFFHTFNNLYSSDKQIIISSDRSPDDLKIFEERLRTRFAWGLTTDIFPPNVELKKSLLRHKIAAHDVAKMIDDDVIDFIANSCENDVRHLEGAITRLYAYSAMNSCNKIDLNFAQEALKDYIDKSIYLKNEISKIQIGVADFYNISVEDLKSKKKSNNITYPRQIAMYLCRMMTDETLQIIGLEFGGRDHTTVIHAIEKISNDLKENDQLKKIISDIKDNII